MIRIPDHWLEEGLQNTGCAVCRTLERLEFDLLARLQGEGDEGVLALTNTGSETAFCNLHFWRLRRLMSNDTAAPFLLNIFEKPILRKGTTLKQSCRVCHFLKETEKELLHQLINQLDVPDVRDRYAKGDGVCLPHLHRILDTEKIATKTKDFLVNQQKESIRRLLPLLKGLIGVSYYSTSKTERSSITRGVEKLIGRDGMTGRAIV